MLHHSLAKPKTFRLWKPCQAEDPFHQCLHRRRAPGGAGHHQPTGLFLGTEEGRSERKLGRHAHHSSRTLILEAAQLERMSLVFSGGWPVDASCTFVCFKQRVASNECVVM